jgi:PmbA protein
VNDDLLGTARSIVERARSGEEIEAFLLHEREFSVKTFAGEIHSLSSAEPRGAGVRLVAAGRVGFAYSTQLTGDDLDDLVQIARSNAASATADEAVALPTDGGGSEQLDELIDPAQEQVTPDDKVSFALELERLTRAADTRVRNVEEAVYSDSDTTVAIANSNGIEGSYRRTDAWCYSIAIATEGDDRAPDVADQTLFVPRTDWILQPILAILPLQLLAYHVARSNGLNVDQPRNLAKTVTVE